MADADNYGGREQSYVKHYILEHYLKRFARIIGSWRDTITYVDCFSGPWGNQADDLSDTSFSIALRELREARQTVQDIWHRNLNLRCMFLERDHEAFSRLDSFAKRELDCEIVTRNAALADAIPDILKFVKEGGQQSFPFFFIDPTGWTGFDLDLIRPLLQFRPSEVLINFMTEHIRRFALDERPEVRASFNRLFGGDEYRREIEPLTDSQDRDDELVRHYREKLQKAGSYDYTCTAIILHPKVDRTYFHLVYATRSRKGVEVFKETEENALQEQETLRADLAEEERVKETGTVSMFAACEATPNSRRVNLMRGRYLDEAQNAVLSLLQSQKKVPYDTLWDMAMSYPLVWERDIKGWVQEWEQQKSCRVLNRPPNERTPKIEKNHVIEWLG